jgi:type III secretory pathway component EscU
MNELQLLGTILMTIGYGGLVTYLVIKLIDYRIQRSKRKD